MYATRFLALYGALSMVVAGLPASAQYYYDYGFRSRSPYYTRYRTPRSLRSRALGVVTNPRPDLLGRIDNAYGRGLISAQEADSLTQQYYGSIANDQRDATSAHMANFDYVLNNLINLRAASLGR